LMLGHGAWMLRGLCADLMPSRGGQCCCPTPAPNRTGIRIYQGVKVFRLYRQTDTAESSRAFAGVDHAA
jgi:hypothetical protein